jgi:hypothetical protein
MESITMGEQTTKPPDIGPAFEIRRRKNGWAFFRIYYAVHRRRCLDAPIILPDSRWAEMQERLSGDELAVTLANHILGRLIHREQEWSNKLPGRAATFED